MKPRLDCRLFRGEKPCRHTVGKAFACEHCKDVAPMGTRIGIVKLDAIGDVARTTALLPALAKRYDPLHVTWLVAPGTVGLLSDNPLIDVVLPYDAASLERLHVERFDLLLSLDKTPRACAVAERVSAAEKRGFGLSRFGTVYPMNADAEYAYRLGLDDQLKFHENERTYQDVIFEVAGLPYAGEEYCLPVTDDARAHAADFCERHGVAPDETVVGLNLGGGEMFANKMWDARRCREFVRELLDTMPDVRVFLFGGPRERRKLSLVEEGLAPRVLSTGPDNSFKQFEALLGRCAVVVTGDSLGMHLALAAGGRVVVLFGPTCAQEIELYGRGEKIVSPIDCAPCYRKTCAVEPSCMERIPFETVLDAVAHQIEESS